MKEEITETDLKILQTTMFLLEDARPQILRNNLIPYLPKAKQIKQILRE